MNRGEVWWVSTPTGPRPFLVLSRQGVIPLLPRLIAVPATTLVRGIPSELALDQDDGMPRECVLSFDNVESVHKSRFRTYVCTLPHERMQEACRTLAITTGCEA